MSTQHNYQQATPTEGWFRGQAAALWEAGHAAYGATRGIRWDLFS